MVQPITHFLENTPGPYYKVVQITSLSPNGQNKGEAKNFN